MLNRGTYENLGCSAAPYILLYALSEQHCCGASDDEKRKIKTGNRRWF